jgi:malate dehydrogenase
VTQLIDKATLDAIIERAKVGGGELVGLMGTSAWYAPGAAAAQMVEAIALDQNRIFPCAVQLSGEYGISDLFVGVPVKLGKGGVKQILEIELDAAEQAMLDNSAEAVRGLMTDLERIMAS